jgi:hypothetical protein
MFGNTEVADVTRCEYCRLVGNPEVIETARWCAEEMEGGDYGIAGSWALFRSISENLCDTVPRCGVYWIPERKHFRTINVQWIGQWGLFSRCGSSENQ